MTRTPDRWRTARCNRCGQDRRLVSGAWLRAVRERAGVPRREVAERMRVSVTYLSYLETDRRDASMRLAMRYLEAVK